MAERARTLDDRTTSGGDVPAAPVIAPVAPVSNREAANRLGADSGTVLQFDEVAGLGGLAGNRAVVNRLGQAGGSGAAPAPIRAAGPAPTPTTTPAGPTTTPAGPTTTPAGPTAAPTTAAPVSATAVAEDPPIEWINGLPDEVRRQIDAINLQAYASANAATKKKYDDQRIANRKTFMATMQWLFGTYEAVQKHFEDVKPMNTDAGHVLYAHVSTRERLRAAQDLLKAQNVPMPMTDVALGMRGDHLHRAGKSPGWFTHAVGFAVDWRAYHGVRITDTRTITLFQTVTGGTPHFEFGMDPQKRIDLITKMGQGRAAEADKTAFLNRLETEYTRLAANSETFKHDLPEANLKKLHDFAVTIADARTALAAAAKRLGQLKAGRAAKDKLDAAQATVDAAQKAFDDAHRAAVTELPKIFEPWVKKLDTEIAKIDKVAADADVDLTKLTGTFGFGELAKKITDLAALQHRLESVATAELRSVLAIHHDALDIAARVDAAQQFLAAPGTATLPPESATWSADLDEVKAGNDAVVAGLGPLETTLHGILPRAVVEPRAVPPAKVTPVRKQTLTALRVAVDKLPARVTRSADKVTPAATQFAEATTDLAAAKRDEAERTAYRAEKVTALGGGADRVSQKKGRDAVEALLQQKLKWLDLKNAKDALLTDVDGYVFKPKDVSDPGITQLVGQLPGTEGGGVFTPDAEGGESKARAGDWDSAHGFNLAFMKAMVSSGFELGVAWKGGSDTMHFELAEGRTMLTTHGAEPVVAGAAMKAQEEKDAKEAAERKAAAEKAAAAKAAADRAATP
jgi:hypothetical protein